MSRFSLGALKKRHFARMGPISRGCGCGWGSPRTMIRSRRHERTGRARELASEPFTAVPLFGRRPQSRDTAITRPHVGEAWRGIMVPSSHCCAPANQRVGSPAKHASETDTPTSQALSLPLARVRKEAANNKLSQVFLLHHNVS